MRNAWIASGVLFSCVACPEGEEPTLESTVAKTAQCVVSGERKGSASPQAAVAAYTSAMNASRWCDVLAVFHVSSRREVAISSFRILVFLSRMPNDYQAQYAEALSAVQKSWGVVLDESRLEQAALEVMNKGTPEFPELATVPTGGMYAETMQHLKSANPGGLVELNDSAPNITIEGEQGTAVVQRQDGRKETLHLRRDALGWFLELKLGS